MMLAKEMLTREEVLSVRDRWQNSTKETFENHDDRAYDYAEKLIHGALELIGTKREQSTPMPKNLTGWHWVSTSCYHQGSRFPVYFFEADGVFMYQMHDSGMAFKQSKMGNVWQYHGAAL